MPTPTSTQALLSEPLPLLQPRPLARAPGSILLVPLLPVPPKMTRLPWELWSHILRFVIFDDDMNHDSPDTHGRRSYFKRRYPLLFVCKDWLEAVEPLIYSEVHIFSISSLQMFVARLLESEQKWDSIRLNPYSTPGRWVQSLNISDITGLSRAEEMTMDALLGKAFPLLPFLRTLCLLRKVWLSTAAVESLAAKDGLQNLTTLRGYSVQWQVDANPPYIALEFLARCKRLERLEIINERPHASSTLVDPGTLDPHDPTFFPSAPVLDFPHLSYLSVIALSYTPMAASLLRASLPALRHLMITPSDDAGAGAASALLAVHGANLQTLRICSPCSWPTPSESTPFAATVLLHTPRLHRLALHYPLAPLVMPATGAHPLRLLTIPRPNQQFLAALEASLAQLPKLVMVRIRNVKWLKDGVYGRALESGVQGEMREWRSIFAKKRVRLVDANWKDPV